MYIKYMTYCMNRMASGELQVLTGVCGKTGRPCQMFKNQGGHRENLQSSHISKIRNLSE